MNNGSRTLRRACPVCETRRGRPLWREEGHTYVRCEDCGLAFTDIEEPAYERARHNAWDEAEPDQDALGFYGDARAAAHTAFLEQFPPWGGRRLLDVGCGLGFFLERARARGWGVHGCEPSASWADLARQRLGHASVTQGDAAAVCKPEGGFDLITAWDVIEHVFEPMSALRAMRQLLAANGRIFLRTPNFAYVRPVYGLRRRLGEEVGLGPLNHIVYFTNRTMRTALEAAGLRPERWLAFPPPQVATFEVAPGRRYAPTRSRLVAAKNGWNAAARLALRASGGRIAMASDLDVLAAPVDRH